MTCVSAGFSDRYRREIDCDMTQPKMREQEPEARRLRRELFEDDRLDRLMAATDEPGCGVDR